MKIGFQGEWGAFSERAARRLALEYGFDKPELEALVDAESVANAVRDGRVRLGVLALHNTIGGEVAESRAALQRTGLKVLRTVQIKINQCLFVRSQEAAGRPIKNIVSHEQALKQSSDYIKSTYPDAKTIPTKDTAQAAKQLSEGLLSEETAVICGLDAGKQYDLHLLEDSIQDQEENVTKFGLIARKRLGASMKQRVKDAMEWLLFVALEDSGAQRVINLFVIGAILLGFYLARLKSWTPWEAVTFATPISGMVFVLTSQRLRRWASHRRVKGFWQYHVVPERKDVTEQWPKETRVVAIDSELERLEINGWLCGSTPTKLFHSIDVLISPIQKRSNALVYTYTATEGMAIRAPFKGIVKLSIYLDRPWRRAFSMEGRYLGYHGDCGNIEYSRISEEQFVRMRGF